MIKKIAIIIFLTFVNICFSQTFDRKTISQKHKINRSLEPEMRGIQVDNVVYYIEDDLQTLTAYENGKAKWTANIIKIHGKPENGAPEIRALEFNHLTITVVYGKHNFAVLSAETGVTKFYGSD